MEREYLNNAELVLLKKNEAYARGIAKKINKLEFQVAKKYFKELIEYSKKEELKTAEAWFSANLGWVYFDMLSMEKALNIQLNTYEIFKELDNIDGMLTCINAIMAIYTNQQIVDKAISWGVSGIDLAESTNNYEMLSIIKANIVVLYIYIEEYTKASEILDEIEKSPFVTGEENELVSYINRVLCETELGNYDKAMKYAEKGYELATLINSPLLAHIFVAKARVNIKKGLLEAGREDIKNAVKSVVDHNDNLLKIDTAIAAGELEYVLGNYERAIEILLDAINFIADNTVKRELKLICKALNECYKAMGDYENAYIYLVKYNKLKNEMFNLNRQTSLGVLDLKKEEQEKNTYKILYNQTEQLYKFGLTITANLDKEDIYNIIAEEVKNFIKYDIISIALYNQSDESLEFQLCIEDGKRVKITPTKLMEETLSGYCVKNRKEIMLNDVVKDSCKYIDYNKAMEMYKSKTEVIESLKVKTNTTETNSALFVPIVIKGSIIGVISTQSYKKNAYTLCELSSLKILSTYIGIALENARLYKKAEYYAMHDALTKVYTKKVAIEKGKEIYDSIITNDNVMATLMLDIDNFKRINDRYGHQLGDRVIESVSATIKNGLRKNDVVGRYGGEEFIIFLEGKKETNFNMIAERIRTNIEKIRIDYDKDEKVSFTVSVGLAITYDNSSSLEKIINNADKALYRAKKTGKNKLEVY